METWFVVFSVCSIQFNLPVNHDLEIILKENSFLQSLGYKERYQVAVGGRIWKYNFINY